MLDLVFLCLLRLFTLAGMSKLHEFKKENMHLVQKYAIKGRKMKKCFKMSYPCNFLARIHSVKAGLYSRHIKVIITLTIWAGTSVTYRTVRT